MVAELARDCSHVLINETRIQLRFTRLYFRYSYFQYIKTSWVQRYLRRPTGQDAVEKTKIDSEIYLFWLRNARCHWSMGKLIFSRLVDSLPASSDLDLQAVSWMIPGKVAASLERRSRIIKSNGECLISEVKIHFR